MGETMEKKVTELIEARKEEAKKINFIDVNLTEVELLKFENIALKKANLQIQLNQLGMQQELVALEIRKKAKVAEDWIMTTHPDNPKAVRFCKSE